MGIPAILQRLGQTDGGATQIRQTINALRGLRDPGTALSAAMANNPAMRQVTQYISANGGDARTAFYRLAKEKGIDPNEIISLFNR